MKRSVKRTGIVVALIGAFTVGFVYLVSSAGVPRAFFEERIRAAEAANNLSQLVEASLNNLATIERYEKEGATDQALALISYEIGNKQDKQNAAVLLATHLETMAKAATEIRSSRARSLGVEAVTTGVSMVSRIVTYNNSLDLLFTAIEQRIMNRNAPSSPSVRALISNINSDARAINELNTAFNNTLATFDKEFAS